MVLKNLLLWNRGMSMKNIIFYCTIRACKIQLLDSTENVTASLMQILCCYLCIKKWVWISTNFHDFLMLSDYCKGISFLQKLSPFYSMWQFSRIFSKQMQIMFSRGVTKRENDNTILSRTEKRSFISCTSRFRHTQSTKEMYDEILLVF